MDDKNKRRDFIDDDRTVSDMSSEWMPWNSGVRKRHSRKKVKNAENAENKSGSFIKPDKEEYKKLVRGQFLAALPMFLCVLAAFAIMFLLARLWLK